MCGISGIISVEKIFTSKIEVSVETISHRGPDEVGFFKSDHCNLGICRLAIVDVSTGQQPNYNQDGRIVSVFNGEIYNFREIRSDLASKGYQITGTGDSALIPYLYEEYGEKFPAKLQGMFAIAVFDTQNKKLFLVRDRLGKKPLWYSRKEKSLFFSSEIKGVLRLGVHSYVNEKVIPEFLQFGFVNAPRSAFKDIEQLPPASSLTFAHGQIQIKQYWNPADVEEISIEFSDAKNETLRLIRESIRTRLVSERPIGAFLSGGIDSTIVTALTQKEFGSPIDTFCIGFSEKRFDESKFANDVSKALGTRHHERIVQSNTKFILETLTRVLDQPFADSSIIPTYLLSQFARESVVVALSGDGGDEVFAGYDRYRAGSLLDLMNPLLIANPLPLVKANKFTNQKLRKFVLHSNHQPLLNRYLGFQSLFQSGDLISILNPDLLIYINMENYNKIWNSIPNNDRIRKMQELDIKSYLPGDLLYKVDMASMANSLEVRSPLLDYRVVEFGLSLPSKYKSNFREGKHILREIARDMVPPALINRPKFGFGIPLAKWLREDLSSVVDDVLLDSTSLQRGWYREGKIKEILRLHRQGRQLDSLIWPMFMLELWAKTWIDQ